MAVKGDELLDMMLRLAETGVHCIELITPTHHTLSLVPVLEKLKARCALPTVWNSSAYESVETLARLDGLIDVYLPDFKYADACLAKKYSNAKDYPSIALAAIREMYRQCGKVTLDADDIIKKGVIIRHLVLPTHRKNSAMPNSA